ncbi:MAG: hypothetical protein ACPL0C_06070 [Candidatus Bathyarchaeales archaeon]
MNVEDVKTTVDVLNELNESYVDFLHSMKGTIREARTAKQLWRCENKSKLIKLGLALIVFPEPTPISETIGSILVAVGAVQQGIKNHAIYVEDVYKQFKNTLLEMRKLKENL